VGLLKDSGKSSPAPAQPSAPAIDDASSQARPTIAPSPPRLQVIQLKLPAAPVPTRYPDETVDDKYAEQVRLESSATCRFIDANDDDGCDFLQGGTPAKRTTCPVCGMAESLEIARSFEPDRVEARCHGGCAAIALAKAIEKVIVQHEDAEADAALAAEMDPARTAHEEPQRWSVPLLAPDRALTLLRGVSGSGKGWLVVYAAVCKALGVPFFGHAVERGRVLVAFLESSAINEARIGFVVRGLGRTMADLSGWLDRWPAGLELKSDNLASRAELARRLRVRKYAAIFVDNTTRLRTSRSQNAENDSAVLSAVLEPLADLAQTGMMDGQRVTESPPAIVVLDHDRGSSAAEQNADYVVSLNRKSKDPESTVTVSQADGCRVVHPDLPIEVQFLGVQPSPVTARVVGDDPDEDDDRLAVLVAAVRADPGIGVNALCRAIGRAKPSVSRDLDALVAAGKLRRDDAKKYSVVVE
jgi:hypothetical protein